MAMEPGWGLNLSPHQVPPELDSSIFSDMQMMAAQMVGGKCRILPNLWHRFIAIGHHWGPYSGFLLSYFIQP